MITMQSKIDTYEDGYMHLGREFNDPPMKITGDCYEEIYGIRSISQSMQKLEKRNPCKDHISNIEQVRSTTSLRELNKNAYKQKRYRYFSKEGRILTTRAVNRLPDNIRLQLTKDKDRYIIRAIDDRILGQDYIYVKEYTRIKWHETKTIKELIDNIDQAVKNRKIVILTRGQERIEVKEIKKYGIGTEIKCKPYKKNNQWRLRIKIKDDYIGMQYQTKKER